MMHVCGIKYNCEIELRFCIESQLILFILGATIIVVATGFGNIWLLYYTVSL